VRIFFVILLVNSSILIFHGQDAPITTAATINDPSPGSITVPITVTNFQNIGAISLSLDYDHSVLNFVGGTQNPSIPGWFIITDNDLGNGFHRILMGWYGNSISLPDGSSIMDIEFTYIDGSTTLAWFNQGGSCEYADENANPLNDIPTSDYYINGHVCGTLGSQNPIVGSEEVCQGETGVSYSTQSVTNATGYNWTVPAGAEISNGQNTNAITVNFSDTAVSGIVSVEPFNPCTSGTPEQFSVTVNELPLADAGSDITIPYETSTVLHAASGGTGDFSYNWTPEDLLVDPNLQDVETILLTNSNLFIVRVTDDESFCQNSDSVLVSISGGPLSVTPIAAPPEICFGESSQLFANAGGGSGNYSYSWTSIPPGNPVWSSNLENPVVSPDSSRVYQVEVYDGFTTTDGQTNLEVHSLPTATISGSDTLCGEEATTSLTVDLTGEPPWSFIYSYQSNSIQVDGVTETPYQLTVSDSGSYVLLDVKDSYCSGTTSGLAVVEKYPRPATPTITQDGNLLHSTVAIGNQWYVNGEIIPGATEQNYTANVSGEYFDIVSINSCNSDTSNVIDVTVVNIAGISRDAFSISPNPASDFIRVNWGNCTSKNVQLIFYNSVGQFIDEYEINCSNNKNLKTIDIGHFKNGLYFINLKNGTINDVKKIIVN
jgi:hypothetical protein